MLPKVSAMSSFPDLQNSPFQTESSAPHLVICCPACRTKFAVESSAVASLEVLRFHCSRCDTVFLMQDPLEHGLKDRSSSTEQISPRWVLTDPTGTIKNEDVGTASCATPPLRSTDFSIGSSSWGAQAKQELPPVAPSSKPANIPSEAISMRSGLSLLDQGQTNIDSQRPASSFASTTLPRTQTVTAKVNHRAENPLRSSSTTRSTPEPASLSAENESLLAKLGIDSEIGLLRRMAARFSPRSRSLIKLSAPLCAAMALILLVSYSARISPRSTGSLLAFALPSTISGTVPQLPPNDLTIRELSLKFVRTPSRETVAVVSGKLFNASPKTIADVTLEARGFNDRGETVITAKAPLRSALANEKVSDLELETIVKFQQSLGAKNSAILPGESAPFTIALLTANDGEDSSDSNAARLPTIKFFSARVFSVH